MAMITNTERKKIDASVAKEFPEDLNAIVPRSSLPRYLRSLGPNDPALQQVHSARKVLSREAELEGLTFGEYIMKLAKRRTNAPLEPSLEGINHLTDAQGRKKAVVIDLKKHGGLWEDFHDILVAESGKNEPRVSFETVKERLRMRNPRSRTGKAPTTKTRARFRQKVESGLKELDDGKGMPHGVVRDRLEKRF